MPPVDTMVKSKKNSKLGAAVRIGYVPTHTPNFPVGQQVNRLAKRLTFWYTG
jgi:hypothetical protein